ncbi:MAG TPA: S16 family serine protease [Nitrospirales bacterium]|nr:S16 family serine protease [Nitrospirales bacterium]
MPKFIRLLSLLWKAMVLVACITVSAEAAEQRYFVSVPTLGVINQSGKVVGATHYLAVQIDRLSQPVGPEIQFNEGSRSLGRLKGGALSPDWKEAAQVAVRAAAQAVAEDPRTWQVTIKNVTDAYLTDGPSASAILAIAIVAALRGVAILPGIALTGAIDGDGNIKAVGGVPDKIQGAASSGFSTVLIPPGQTRTRDWDVRPLSESLRLTVIEVRTLREAYERMTGTAF